MQNNLNGLVVLITGGGGEIGGATARAAAARGAKIAIADVSLDSANRAADELRAQGYQAIALQTDVAEESSVVEMAAKIREAFGRIDAVYAAAAALGLEMQQKDLDVANLDVEIWDRAMAVNLRGPMLCTKHVLPMMLEQGYGSIIYACSGLAFQGEITRTAYSASKLGLASLARSVATQYGRQGVRANALQIGFVPPVRSSKPTLPQVVALLGKQNLVPEILKPENIADVVVFLASKASYAITGQTVVADGGFSAHTPTMTDMLEFLERTQLKEM